MGPEAAARSGQSGRGQWRAPSEAVEVEGEVIERRRGRSGQGDDVLQGRSGQGRAP
jgi:hypothetical protein